MRTEEEIIAGVVRVKLGGRTAVTIDMPDRTIDETTDWQRQLTEAVGGVIQPDLQSPDAAMGLVARIGPSLNALIVAYDTSGQVTDELLRRSTPGQAYAAFKTVLEAVYPYVRDVQSAISILGPMVGLVGSVAPVEPKPDQQPGEPSMNGRSPRGGRTPAKSAAD